MSHRLYPSEFLERWHEPVDFTSRPFGILGGGAAVNWGALRAGKEPRIAVELLGVRFSIPTGTGSTRWKTSLFLGRAIGNGTSKGAVVRRFPTGDLIPWARGPTADALSGSATEDGTVTTIAVNDLATTPFAEQYHARFATAVGIESSFYKADVLPPDFSLFLEPEQGVVLRGTPTAADIVSAEWMWREWVRRPC